MQSYRWMFLLAILSSQVWAQDWQVQKESEGVVVYSRATDASYDEVRAVTTVKSRVAALMALLDDTNAGPAWIARCRKVETIGWFGPDKRTVHTFFSSPWPLADRDMVTFSQTYFDSNDGSMRIEIVDKGQQRQTISNYVRMTNIKGTWLVMPLEDGMVEISYQGYGEAGGVIPGWLSNKLMVKSIHETFVNLRHMITLEKYQKPKHSTK